MSESLFNKIAGIQICNFNKKRPQHRSFPVNIAKFLRTTFFYKTPPVAAFVDQEIHKRLHESWLFLLKGKFVVIYSSLIYIKEKFDR